MQLQNFMLVVDQEVVVKLFISLVLGFVIGLERELTNKSAGLRTHILVCLGSTVFTMISIYGFPQTISPTGIMMNDPARVSAQILAGIGFIGGGAVLRHGASVKGLTTAASLWITASIGMAVGTGSYGMAVLTAALSFLVLVLIRYIERYYLGKYTRKGARIKAIITSPSEYAVEIQEWFYKEFKNSIIEMNSTKSARDDNFVKLTFVFDYFCNDPLVSAHQKLNELKYVDSLSVQHINEDI